MTAIAVIPEGRNGVWLVDRDSLKAWIIEQQFESIHNFAAGPMLLGADWTVESVLEDIDRASMVGLLTGDAVSGNLGHSLSLIMPPDDLGPERLSMFDIGHITDADLDVRSL
jgi:hypothetical protein